jgi:hypothetical protein
MAITAAERRRTGATEARDHLRDVLELLGVDARVDVVHAAASDQPVVQLAALRTPQARNLAEALIAGAMSRRLILTPGAPVWSMRNRGVGVITTVTREHVVLRCLATGERWHSGATDLRAATLNEINTARESAAHAPETTV